MSSRFVKKNNIVFLGLPKNGSQAIKQIYKKVRAVLYVVYALYFCLK